MKVFKRVLATVMTTALVFTSANFVAVSDVNAAPVSSIKVLNGKKKTIAVGDSFKVVLKVSPSSAVISYKSSNKKVAKVSAKGMVKGVKPGKATITAKGKDGGKKATVKVTVTPKKITSVNVETVATANDQVKVTWKAQKNVTGYQILSSTKQKKGYKVVATVKGAKKTNTIVNGLAGGTHYFKVRAYKAVGKKKITGDASKVVSTKLWNLVWSDEFNGTTLDMNAWTYETGNGIDGWGNQELEIYTAGKNIKFQDGSLVIIPRMEYNTATKKISNVTSTRIISRGKKQFKYGKIEIRAKASKGTGTWSAGWMLGTNGQTWPANGEIDIFESMNGGVPQTIHCPYFNNMAIAKGGNKNFNSWLSQTDSAAEYHTYGIIWDDTKITFTIDGKVNGVYDPSIYSQKVFPLSETWTCFQSPFYFILNCAVGGNAAGAVSTNGWTLTGTNGNVQTYEDYCYIDYVRVYQ